MELEHCGDDAESEALEKVGREVETDIFGNRRAAAGIEVVLVSLVIKVDIVAVSVPAIYAQLIVKSVTQGDARIDRRNIVRIAVEEHLVVEDTHTWNDIDVVFHEPHHVGEAAACAPEIHVFISPGISSAHAKKDVVIIIGSGSENPMRLGATVADVMEILISGADVCILVNDLGVNLLPH